MKLQGAVVEEKGVTFAIVKVEKSIFDVPGRARDRMASVQPLFPNMSVVFMAEDASGMPNFYGRPDIINIIADTELDNIEWKEYAMTETEDDGKS